MHGGAKLDHVASTIPVMLSDRLSPHFCWAGYVGGGVASWRYEKTGVGPGVSWSPASGAEAGGGGEEGA